MARCRGCSGAGSGECSCSVVGSDCVSAEGSGTALDPIVVSLDIDPDSDNQLSCGPSGLLVPTAPQSPPCFSLYTSPAITVANDADLIVLFDQESYDDTSMHSIVSNTTIVTFAEDGKWHLGGGVEWGADNDGYRLAQLLINGPNAVASTTVAAVQVIQTYFGLSRDYAVSAGDQLQMRIRHTAGGPTAAVVTMWGHRFSD